MHKTLNILGNSLLLTMQELRVNKLRTALSLTGISFGIFCIIGVLATVNSLEMNVQNDIKSLGSNTIYIDKWDYSGGPDYPWWKFVNRPVTLIIISGFCSATIVSISSVARIYASAT